MDVLPLPKLHCQLNADVSGTAICPEKLKVAGIHAPTPPLIATWGLATTFTGVVVLTESVQPNWVVIRSFAEYNPVTLYCRTGFCKFDVTPSLKVQK